MPSFRYRVMTPSGEIKSDIIEKENRIDAITALQNGNMRIISVEEERGDLASMKIGGKKKLGLKSLILFCRQLATLLRSGVPLIKCFDIIASQSNDKFFKTVLGQISQDIQAGSVLSAAVEKQGEVFPPMLSKMLAIGEETGDMAAIVDRMANQYESDSRIRSQVKGAMTYPLVLVVVAFIACAFMMIAIVPQFEGIFAQADTELPGLTKVLMAMSKFMTTRWYVLLVTVPVIVLVIIRFFRNKKVKRWVDSKKLTVQPLANPMQKMMSAQFARTLHTLISSGIPIVSALESTRDNVNNLVVQDAIDDLSLGVQKGKGLSEQMKNYPYFPNLLVSMISIGEASGNLEEMLSKTANYYDEELDAAIGQLMTILEPMMILVVGLLIGVIVMALYLPMFGMITAMQSLA